MRLHHREGGEGGKCGEKQMRPRRPAGVAVQTMRCAPEQMPALRYNRQLCSLKANVARKRSSKLVLHAWRRFHAKQASRLARWRRWVGDCGACWLLTCSRTSLRKRAIVTVRHKHNGQVALRHCHCTLVWHAFMLTLNERCHHCAAAGCRAAVSGLVCIAQQCKPGQRDEILQFAIKFFAAASPFFFVRLRHLHFVRVERRPSHPDRPQP